MGGGTGDARKRTTLELVDERRKMAKRTWGTGGKGVPGILQEGKGD